MFRVINRPHFTTSFNYDMIELNQKKGLIKIICDWYYECRGWNKLPKEFWNQNGKNPKYNYARNMRDSKLLYNFFQGNMSKIMGLVYDWSKKDFSDWRLTTIINYFKNQSRGL